MSTGTEGAGKFGTNYPHIFAMLAAEFEPDEVFSRTIKDDRGGSGRTEYYIRPRAAMNRLDNVMGPENWEDDCTPFGPNGSVKCVLTLTMPDGKKVRKSGVGSPQKPGQANSDKSAESDAFKRAAMKFGIARYLYRDGVPSFLAEVSHLEGPAVPLTPAAAERFEQARQPQQAPARREPERHREPERGATPRREEPARGQERQGHGPPRTGKAMYAWTLDQEKQYDVHLLKYMNSWSRLQDFPARMVDWDERQVALAHAEAVRKLRSLNTESDMVHEEALSN